MAVWSDGYFTDIQYTAKFYAELAPGFLAFACLRQGVRPPAMGEDSTYLELGCGQGYGLNLLAAANPGMRFWGVDFHPGQIDNARRLAGQAALANVAFEDWSFEQLLGRPKDLPRFDVIALHGVYSWVSAGNRAMIVQILDRFLQPGGLAYVSYNCLPGWATLAPLQRFVAEHVARGSGPSQARVVAALRAALQMLESPTGYFESVPALKARIEAALREDPAYLVHEYLNGHSQPLYHADVAAELEAARLTFAASANVADDLVNLAAPAALHPVIQAAQDPVWRESLLDYASNKPFRRDIFVRGRNILSDVERESMLDALELALLAPPEATTFEIPIPIGQVKGQPAVYQPIVEALADGPRTLGELRKLPQFAGARDGAVMQALTLLIGSRQIHPVSAGGADAATAVRFNRAALARAEFGEIPTQLAAASPGTGIRVDFTDLMAVNGVLQGLVERPDEAARLAWPLMARTGRRLLRDGQTLPDQAANEAELARRIAAFNGAKLPLFRSLGVV
jgi:SAM-dependent methyltransferase